MPATKTKRKVRKVKKPATRRVRKVERDETLESEMRNWCIWLNTYKPRWSDKIKLKRSLESRILAGDLNEHQIATIKTVLAQLEGI